MHTTKFKLTKPDPEMRELIKHIDHKILAIWAKQCAQRVLTYFTHNFPKDDRPQKALNELQNWINTRKFSMKVIRKASLDAHAAAREVGKDSPAAKSAARACGQAVATVHVKTHAYGPAIYAQQAIFRDTNSMEKVNNERNWQYRELIKLIHNY